MDNDIAWFLNMDAGKNNSRAEWFVDPVVSEILKILGKEFGFVSNASSDA